MDGLWIDLGLYSLFGTIVLGLAYVCLVVLPKEREEKRTFYLTQLAQHRAAWAEEQKKRAQAEAHINRRKEHGSRRKEHANRHKEKASAAKKRAEEAAARIAARIATVEEHKKSIAQKVELRKQQLAQRSRSATDEPTS